MGWIVQFIHMQQKGFSNIALIVIFVVIVAGIIGYFVIKQKPATPSQNAPENTKSQITNWTEYRWGILKFRYPSDWKIEANSTSVVLIPPARTSFFIISQVQAANANEDNITIGGQIPCSVLLRQGYRCETMFGFPIFTASKNSETITVFQEVLNSATLVISSRDIETGMAVEAIYIVNNKIYTENELNSYIKKAPPGRYDIVAKANGYEDLSSYIVLPFPQDFSMRFMMSPLVKPPELSDSYLQQFTKPGTGLIVGFVVDEDGQPLSGVAVNSPNYNTTTNNRGFYALNAIITESGSCAGVDITFSKSGYKTEKHLHAMSGSVIPRKSDGSYISPLWDGRINITLQRGSGQNVTDYKHKLCQ